MVFVISGVLKVSLTLGTALAVSLFFQKKQLKLRPLLLTALTLLFAVCANAVSGVLPPLRDTVTLTALGEKRGEAQKEEVYLSGFTIDGREYSCLESLQIQEGKWFWNGEKYCWRIETDTRQPEGTTRTVVLKIPVGAERTLNFAGDVWRGKVEIRTTENTWICDTYSEQGAVVSEQIGGSAQSILLLDQVYHFAVYTAVYMLLFGAAALIAVKVIQDPESAHAWLERNSGRLVYGGIAATAFGFMVHYADKYSLWYDGVATITMTCGTISEAFLYCFNLYDYTPPLFDVCAALWYHIAPYGQRWLLLISIIPAAGSSYLAGVLCERLKGKHCGVFAALFIGFSTSVWLNAAYQYRTYGFLVFFSILTCYCYILRNEGRKHSKLFFCTVHDRTCHEQLLWNVCLCDLCSSRSLSYISKKADLEKRYSIVYYTRRY